MTANCVYICPGMTNTHEYLAAANHSDFARSS